MLSVDVRISLTRGSLLGVALTLVVQGVHFGGLALVVGVLHPVQQLGSQFGLDFGVVGAVTEVFPFVRVGGDLVELLFGAMLVSPYLFCGVGITGFCLGLP